MASKAGFAGFTNLPNFREKIGVKVNKALKLGHDGICHAAIDMVCALMEPMHEDYDLRQEQLNKSSLLSSERFLDGLLDMWTTHVVRKNYVKLISRKIHHFFLFSDERNWRTRCGCNARSLDLCPLCSIQVKHLDPFRPVLSHFDSF